MNVRSAIERDCHRIDNHARNMRSTRSIFVIGGPSYLRSGRLPFDPFSATAVPAVVPEELFSTFVAHETLRIVVVLCPRQAFWAAVSMGVTPAVSTRGRVILTLLRFIVKVTLSDTATRVLFDNVPPLIDTTDAARPLCFDLLN